MYYYFFIIISSSSSSSIIIKRLETVSLQLFLLTKMFVNVFKKCYKKRMDT